MSDNARFQKIKVVSYVNAVTNTLLAVFKIVIGYIGHSHALIADGIHSFSDLISDALVLFASKLGGKHADADHPYGHHRIETIASIIIALILIFVAVGIIYDTWQHLSDQSFAKLHGTAVLIVALVSIAANEALFRYTLHAGQSIQSNLLISNAWHNRSDALVSLIVLASIIMSLLGLRYFDAIGAIVIAVLIFRIGLKMIWNNLNELIDASAKPETLNKLKQIIKDTPGVEAIHMLRTRLHANNIMVDVHIIVDPKISVSEGHYISDQVQLALKQCDEPITDVTVHIDPEDDEHEMKSLNLPDRETLEHELKTCWANLPAYEKLQLHYLDGLIQVDLYFPLALQSKVDEQAYQACAKAISQIDKVTCYFYGVKT